MPLVEVAGAIIAQRGNVGGSSARESNVVFEFTDTWTVPRFGAVLPRLRLTTDNAERTQGDQVAYWKVHPREPHWYLYLLGTDSAHQGRGHGSAVLQPVLERCDDEVRPAYLESSKEVNIPFCRRHGFEVRSEFCPINGCPPMWPMWREPR